MQRCMRRLSRKRALGARASAWSGCRRWHIECFVLSCRWASHRTASKLPRGRNREAEYEASGRTESKRVLRIGVISAYPDDDWHARRIVEAAARVDRVDVLAPTEFSAEVAGRCVRIMVRGRDAGEWDLFLTPRALGDDGDADVQLELYRVLARSGACLVNDVDALLVAICKFRSCWGIGS